MMRLPKFEFHSPSSVGEAMRIVAEAGGNAAYVAGGTDLYPNMKRRQQTPGVVVNLMDIEELHRVEPTPDGGVAIGACATLTGLLERTDLAPRYPALWEALRVISTPLLRNMGTIGGNVLLDTRCNYYDQNYEWRRGINFCMKKDGEICWVAPSSPRCWAVQSSDTVPVLVALGARLQLCSPEGEREVEARDFYRDDGIRYVDKRPGELLARIVLSPGEGRRSTYRKLRRRGSFDFPVLGVAVCLRLDRERVRDAHVVLGGVGSAPLEAKKAEEMLEGSALDEGVIEAAAEAAYGPARPLDNTDFAHAWRKQMVRKYVREALQALV
jgi:4-hydroxybenzoyl-CoA reductase subunit beta